MAGPESAETTGDRHEGILKMGGRVILLPYLSFHSLNVLGHHLNILSITFGVMLLFPIHSSKK